MLLASNDIIASYGSDFKLTVDLSNYYIRTDDSIIFTVNGEGYTVDVKDRVTIEVNFNVALTAGSYKYDLAITRDNKTLTILHGDFIVRESLKYYLISLIHKLYRGDVWINNMFDSVGMALSEVKTYLELIHDNNYFDTATNSMLEQYEKEAGIILAGGQTIEERKSQLIAKWRGSSKCTLETLQGVSDAWRNGTIEVEFIGGKIHIKFISPIGIPKDLQGLKNALEVVKPAHLAIYYTFMYKTWGNAKNAGTWGYHKNAGTWNLLRQNEED